MPIPVEVAVHLAAVPPLAASGTLLQGHHVLVRRAGVTRGIVTALGVLFCSIGKFLIIGELFLCRVINYHETISEGKKILTNNASEPSELLA